jgi:voltage-gated potassium channel
MKGDVSAMTRMTRGALVLLAAFLVGVIGYLLFGWTLLDAIYMVVITIFGVGYGEVNSLDSAEEKIFTMALIITGCSALIYILGGFFQLIAEGELNRALGKLKMTKQIKKLTGHVIVCGYGRIGRVLAERLRERGVDVVVVDSSEQRASAAAEAGFFAHEGNASQDQVLIDVGIAQAKTLCTVLPNDAMNVFIALTARSLNPGLTILARGEDPETEPKLMHAGADQVVMPSATSAHRMADMITRPNVLDYLEAGEKGALDGDLEGLGLTLLNLPLDETAEGHDVGDLEREARVSLMVVALKRSTGETIDGPDLELPLHAGDSVILLVRPEHKAQVSARFSQGRRKLTYRGASISR